MTDSKLTAADIAAMPEATANRPPRGEAKTVMPQSEARPGNPAPVWTKPAFTVRTFTDPPPAAPATLAGTWHKPAFIIRQFVDITPADYTRHWQQYRTPLPDHQPIAEEA